MAYRQFKRKKGAKGRYRYDEVKFFIENEVGWKLLSKNYKNASTPLEVICPFGHNTSIIFENFKTRQECPICELGKGEIVDFKVDELSKPFNGVFPAKKKRRVLGLDQATHISGYSIFEGNELLTYGKFTNKKSSNPIERIEENLKWLSEVIEITQVDHVVLEGIQLQGDLETYTILAKNLGAIEALLLRKGIKYSIVQCGTWRSYSKVKGRARIEVKSNARKRVRDLYHQVCSEDEADAILIGRYGADIAFEVNKIKMAF